MSDNKSTDNKQRLNLKVRDVKLPSQIPLLEDVIDDGNISPAKPPRKQNRTPELDPLDKPLATDLFGDPIHSYAVIPEPSAAINEEELRSQATQVVNSLVKEYSHEIVRRLRNELTSVLNDLDIDKPGSAGQHHAALSPQVLDNEQEQKPEPDSGPDSINGHKTQ